MINSLIQLVKKYKKIIISSNFFLRQRSITDVFLKDDPISGDIRIVETKNMVMYESPFKQ